MHGFIVYCKHVQVYNIVCNCVIMIHHGDYNQFSDLTPQEFKDQYVGGLKYHPKILPSNTISGSVAATNFRINNVDISAIHNILTLYYELY
jgi:hypothetical protein